MAGKNSEKNSDKKPNDMYQQFVESSFIELEQLLIKAQTREERAFYRALLNLKLQIEQEKVVGEVLL